MRASSTGKRSASRGVGGLDYKRFDNIVDSDDDDDHTPTVTSPMPDALRDMPPALRLALAKVEAAKEHGSETMVKDAMRELDARLNDMPPSFKRKFLGASSEAAQPPARAKDERREALDKLPPGLKSLQISSVLKHLSCLSDDVEVEETPDFVRK